MFQSNCNYHNIFPWNSRHSAKFDRVESASMGITATRPVGEESSLLLNLAHTTSNQYKEADDDFQSFEPLFMFHACSITIST